MKENNPLVTEVAAIAEPTVELLCRPEARTLLGYTRRILHLKQEKKLALLSFSYGGPANWLFLISTEDGETERYAVPADEQASHGAALGCDGNIYAVTFMQYLHRFDVEKRRWTTLCRPLDEGERPWDAIGAPNRCIYFGTYPNACFGEYDIDSGKIELWRHVAPRAKYADSFSILPDGRIKCRAWGPETFYVTFDAETREFVQRMPGQQNLFRVEVEGGAWEEAPSMIARVTGEPMCALGFKGKVYLGIYVRCLLLVYDPEMPFAYGKNPREIAEIGHEQLRPRGFATDGERVYMVSHANYSTLGGALTTLEPETEEVRVFRHVVRDQKPTSLVYDPLTGYLFGGTYRWGDCDSHPPTCESAAIFVWDPRGEQTVGEYMPWPGADQIVVRGVLPGGVLVAQRDTEVALFHTATLEEIGCGAFPGGGLRTLLCLEDGRVYGLTAQYLFRWDVEEEQIVVLASVDMKFLAIPEPGCFILATDNAVYRLDLPQEI